MTVRELGEWLAYYAVDPWGEQRADLRNGILAAQVANALGAEPRATPADFMLYREPREVSPPPADINAQVRTALLNATQRGFIKRQATEE